MKMLQLLDKLSQFENATSTAGSSRRDAFRHIGSGALQAAKVLTPLGLAAFIPNRAFAQGGNNVVDVLNFALLLEYLEAEYYQTALDTNGLLDSQTRPVIELIAQHESAHVDFLRSAISSANGTPIDKPAFDFTADGTFSDVFSNQATFLALAQAFEDTGVRAYKGQAGNLIGADDVLTAALRIHSVEARHAAMIRRMRGQQGWIPFAEGIDGVPAADPVYAGENNITQLGLNAVDVTNGISAESVTEAYDEPLSRQEVTNIASLFLA